MRLTTISASADTLGHCAQGRDGSTQQAMSNVATLARSILVLAPLSDPEAPPPPKRVATAEACRRLAKACLAWSADFERGVDCHFLLTMLLQLGIDGVLARRHDAPADDNSPGCAGDGGSAGTSGTIELIKTRKEVATLRLRKGRTALLWLLALLFIALALALHVAWLLGKISLGGLLPGPVELCVVGGALAAWAAERKAADAYNAAGRRKKRKSGRRPRPRSAMDRYFSCSGKHDANDDDDDDSSDDDDGGCDEDDSEEEKEEMTRRHVGQFPVEFGELDRVVGRHFETRDADSGDSSGDGSSGDGSSCDGSSGDISGDGGGRGEGGGSGGSDGAENMTASSAPRRGCLAGFVIAGARGERRLQRTCVRELVLCGRAHDARLLGGLVSSSGGADSVAARDGLLAIAGLAPEANASKFLLGRLGIAPTLGIAVLRLFGDDSGKVAAAAQCVPPPASLPHSRSATCRSCAILMCNERVTLLSAYEHLSQRCPPRRTSFLPLYQIYQPRLGPTGPRGTLLSAESSGKSSRSPSPSRSPAETAAPVRSRRCSRMRSCYPLKRWSHATASHASQWHALTPRGTPSVAAASCARVRPSRGCRASTARCRASWRCVRLRRLSLYKAVTEAHSFLFLRILFVLFAGALAWRPLATGDA